jgi:predicted alpha/beta hydrolase family esterase
VVLVNNDLRRSETGHYQERARRDIEQAKAQFLANWHQSVRAQLAEVPQ